MPEKRQDRPTVAQLRQWFQLDPVTGRLHWRESHGGYRLAGQEAMKSTRANGSRFGRLPGTEGTMAAAVVVWAIDRGRWPSGKVGHANGDLTDNRPANLVGPGEGTARRSVRSDSVTGLKGVSPKRGRFQASVHQDGRMRYLGLFDTEAEASEAIQRASDSREATTQRAKAKH